MHYTDDALEAAAKLAARHLRDYRLPDSAIDVIDEAGAKSRMKRSMDPNRPPVTDPATPVEPIEISAANIEEVVARMARIPAKQASSSDRERLRTLEESLGRVVFGQEEAVAPSRRRSSARAPASGSPIGRPAASSSRARPASARPSSPSSWRCTSATSSSAST